MLNPTNPVNSKSIPGEYLASKWEQTSMLELWHSQLIQHHKETYKGIGLAKFPQDLWSYEKLLNISMPEVIIEIGINEGDSLVGCTIDY